MNYVGEIFELGEGNNLECIFETNYDSKHILLLHPVDAPEGMMFVIMYMTKDEELLPITNPIIGERIVQLYEQKNNINTREIEEEFNQSQKE